MEPEGDRTEEMVVDSERRGEFGEDVESEKKEEVVVESGRRGELGRDLVTDGRMDVEKAQLGETVAEGQSRDELGEDLLEDGRMDVERGELEKLDDEKVAESRRRGELWEDLLEDGRMDEGSVQLEKVRSVGDEKVAESERRGGGGEDLLEDGRLGAESVQLEKVVSVDKEKEGGSEVGEDLLKVGRMEVESGKNEEVVSVGEKTVEEVVSVGEKTVRESERRDGSGQYLSKDGAMEWESEKAEKEVTKVGEKRMAEGELDVSKKKKRRRRFEKEMKRVAEICLTLSTMGKMRGGRNPSEVEVELMKEARKKLVELCEEMKPKEVVSKEAVRVVIEELGLNNSRGKDQRLGFRPPVMSVKEKWELSKRKMEEAKKFAAQSGIHSSQAMQAGLGPKAESHGALSHAAHRYPPGRPNATAISAGRFEAALPPVRASVLPSTSSSNLVHANEVKSTVVSRVPPGSSQGRDSSLPLPRTDVVHFRVDGRTNMSTYASQVRENASTHSPQLQSGAAKLGLVNKVPEHKVEGATQTSVSQLVQATRDRIFKPSASQTGNVSQQSAHQPSQAANFVQASSSHIEIAKDVQNFLHPRLPEHPNWIPPSTDYMNKILACQMCSVSINDTETVLVCDACEKGYHLKCIQSFIQKGLPKNEWHCPKCLQMSNGKPFPPKYGRVTRNISAPKVSQNTGGVQVPSEKKVGVPDQKVNHQKVSANGNLGSMHTVNLGRMGINHTETASGHKQSSVREVQGVKVSDTKMKMDDNHVFEHKLLPKSTTAVVCIPPFCGPPNRSSNQPLQNSRSSSCKPVESVSEHTSFPCRPQESISEHKSLPKSELGNSCPDKLPDTSVNSHHRSQASCISKGVGKAMQQKDAVNIENQYLEVKASDVREASRCKPWVDVRKDEKDVAQRGFDEAAAVANGARDCLKSSSAGLHNVSWVGDILQIVDEKAYYNSCHVNGMVYKLQDHALFRSNKGNLRPSKIQALWEDTKTGSRWAIVNSCYFPADLPEVVGQPCAPENNEVYESNHGSTVRAGLIQGPCDVLPPKKFKEENERRIHSDDADGGRQPVYLCKWFYDESKGLFRPVTD